MKLKRTFQILFTLCVIFPLSFSYADNDPGLAQRIEPLIQQKMPHSHIGILLQDAKTGKVIYERRANENFLPASTTKLLTAAAALYSLGPDYRYETNAKLDPQALKQGVLTGDLFIQFNGDPSLTSQDLKTLIKDIKTAGVNEIVGDVVIDNTRFQGPNYALGWAWNSLPWAFSAPVTSVILNENLVKLNLTPSKTLGEKASLKVADDELTKLNITDDIISVSESEANDRCQIMLDVNSQNELTAYGCWPAKETSDTLKVALQNPTLLARQLISDALKAENIKLTGQIALGVGSKELKAVASHKSKPISELLKTVLNDSNNIYADSITKTMGAERLQQGSFQAGVLAMQDVLAKNLGLEVQSLRLRDGSGLSRYNVISPNHLAKVLYVMYQNKNLSKYFKEGLSISGEEGTLKNRLMTTDLIGHIQAKTGSMIGTSSLAGYVTTRNKQELIFVIMINNAAAENKDLNTFENTLCEIFAGL